MSRPRAFRRKTFHDSARSGELCARPKPSPRIGLRASDNSVNWIVADDWPEIPPATRAEIDVIETWFADLLDEILGPRR